MGLPRFIILKQLLTNQPFKTPQPFSKPTIHYSQHLNYHSHFNNITTRTYHFYPEKSKYGNTLHSKVTLFVAGAPNSSVVPFLDQWVQEGHKVRDTELQKIVRTLRSKKRFDRALEVSEWMSGKKQGDMFPGDIAVQLDLIGKVHGVEAAERYFNEISDHSEKVYGALLNCYVRENLIDKSLSHFKKMKDMGLARNSLNYNSIMTLYMNTDQLEKIPEVLSEMEENGVSPDNVSYRLCIKSYGLRSDFTSIEKLLEQLKSKPEKITIQWNTYTTVASYYIEGGLNERAIHYLQKAEEIVNVDGVGYNNLITSYANLGDVNQVMRLWRRHRSVCKMQINIDFINIMGSLVKLNEIEEAERIFQEWETGANLYDFRVPNVLLIGYTKKGETEKAEKMLEDIIGRGKTPIPNSWSILAAGYINGDNMEKGLECMKRAIELGPRYKGWLPKPELVSSILNWLGDEGDFDELEAFVTLLSGVGIEREVYHTLLKVNIRHGREIGGVLQWMKDDNLDVDEETKRILGSR